MYDRIVQNLRDAANRGEEEARQLLSDLGESVESTGQKMQDAASREHEEGVRH
jgi:hypothetical protein